MLLSTLHLHTHYASISVLMGVNDFSDWFTRFVTTSPTHRIAAAKASWVSIPCQMGDRVSLVITVSELIWSRVSTYQYVGVNLAAVISPSPNKSSGTNTPPKKHRPRHKKFTTAFWAFADFMKLLASEATDSDTNVNINEFNMINATSAGFAPSRLCP